MMTAGGKWVSTVKLTVCAVVWLAMNEVVCRAGWVDVEAQRAADHVAGLTGRLIVSMSTADSPQVTCCAESADVSVWRSRKPRLTKMWKKFSPSGSGLYRRSGTVQVPNRAVNGAAWDPERL